MQCSSSTLRIPMPVKWQSFEKYQLAGLVKCDTWNTDAIKSSECILGIHRSTSRSVPGTVFALAQSSLSRPSFSWYYVRPFSIIGKSAQYRPRPIVFQRASSHLHRSSPTRGLNKPPLTTGNCKVITEQGIVFPFLYLGGKHVAQKFGIV